MPSGGKGYPVQEEDLAHVGLFGSLTFIDTASMNSTWKRHGHGWDYVH